MSEYDALVVLSGGLDASGEPNAWSRSRLDRAVDSHRGEYIIVCSAGTTHKPPVLDRYGFPIFESISGARYLRARGVSPNLILPEFSSYDTVGNAYFSRVIHAEPRQFRNLTIITSEFHMPRAKTIFEWIYSLHPNPKNVSFESVADDGLDQLALEARKARERESLERLKPLMEELGALAEVHEWLFGEHRAYGLEWPESDAGVSLATY